MIKENQTTSTINLDITKSLGSIDEMIDKIIQNTFCFNVYFCIMLYLFQRIIN